MKSVLNAVFEKPEADSGLIVVMAAIGDLKIDFTLSREPKLGIRTSESEVCRRDSPYTVR